MLDVILKTTLYGFYIMLGLLLFLVYKFYIKQIFIRRKYKNLPNVYIEEGWYIPIIGDFVHVARSVKKGKHLFYHMVKDAITSSKVTFSDL